jgi:hypothetical protein
MTEINTERLHAEMDEPFVVFLIGMRIHSLWRVWEWLPVFLAMPRMLRELTRADGLLGSRTKPGLRNWMVVQYWRSFEDLEAYAIDPDAEHRPAWRRYDDELADSGAVGIWHETYLIAPDGYETVYNNMPDHGLGEVGRLVPASGRRARAGSRLDPSSDAEA